MKIGIFGGSFDPPHLSHLSVCESTLSLTDIDELMVIPCYEHAFGKVSTSFQHRLRMCEIAFCEMGRVRISDVERELGGRSFTVNTIEHLCRTMPETEFALVIGADAYLDRNGWRDFDQITQLAELIVFGRHGVGLDRPVLPAPPPLSSTEIRNKLARGEEIAHLVSRGVLEYIEEHGLYQK